jgi:deazaflavin-dependent oxidoreductase (nitroreductase family)
MAVDYNAKNIEEFRANQGRLGGYFAGAPITLVHHRGRTTGREHVSPMMYMQSDDDPSVIYVFATKSGQPDHPEWYHNLIAAGAAEVEVGTETYPVTVTEITGAERDRVYAEHAGRYPAFAGYEEKTRGIRTIPVLALRRA